MRTRRLRLLIRPPLVLGLVLPFLVGSFSANAAAVPQSVRVKLLIGGRAEIGQHGGAARIALAGGCTSGAEVLEAFVYISQDGHTSDLGFIPLVCDGAKHRWLVEVHPFDQPFHPGKASASAYALVMDFRTGETAEDSPFRDIRMFG